MKTLSPKAAKRVANTSTAGVAALVKNVCFSAIFALKGKGIAVFRGITAYFAPIGPFDLFITYKVL